MLSVSVKYGRFLNYLLCCPDRSIDMYSYCSSVTVLSLVLAEYSHSIAYGSIYVGSELSVNFLKGRSYLRKGISTRWWTWWTTN